MAMSDYDVLAFNEDAKPCSGTIIGFKEGSSCSIHKTWMYVRDEKMWVPGRQFDRPTIARITEGDMFLSGFEIRASRGPQNSIFVHIVCTNYDKGDYDSHPIRRLGGIGCNGCKGPWDLIMEEEGLDPEEWKPYTHSSEWDCEAKETWYGFDFVKISKDVEVLDIDLETISIYRTKAPEYEYQWVGVTKETLNAFYKWLKEDPDYAYEGKYRDWVQKVVAAEALRVNQGDLFFAEHTDLELSATPPEQGEEPVAMQLIKGMSGPSKDTESEKE